MFRRIRNLRNRIKNLRGFELSEVVINGRIFEAHFTKKKEKTKEQKTNEVIDTLMNG